MKTLKNAKIKVSEDGKSVTISADVIESEFNGLLLTRVSHFHSSDLNPRHPRCIQSSNESVFVRTRAGVISFPNDFMVAVAASIEPLTSFPPIIRGGSPKEGLDISSELPVNFQWQISDDPAPKGEHPPPVAKWENIQGETGKSLEESKVQSGKFIRCMISNAAGQSITQAAKKV